MPFASLFGRPFLMNRGVLWTLFAVNLLGTIYGYLWYGDQLLFTIDNKPAWMIPFVPDSPTASLFFTLSLLYLLFPPERPSLPGSVLRAVIEGMAAVTSVKYGIWAVVMIFAGAAQGDPLNWQHYMLVVSHLGMAVEALLYARFMQFGRMAAFAATLWLLLNDTVDYTFGVNPWLPKVLDDDMPAIRTFTYGLSLFSMLTVWLAVAVRGRTGKR